MKETGTGAHDMFADWKRTELNMQKDRLDSLKVALSALENKDSSYARGIRKMILLRERIIEQFGFNYEDKLIAQEQAKYDICKLLAE